MTGANQEKKMSLVSLVEPRRGWHRAQSKSLQCCCLCWQKLGVSSKCAATTMKYYWPKKRLNT